MASTENSTETNYEAWIKKCPDFNLVTGTGDELKCHKNFLCMHSPVFETMINSEFKEAKLDRATIQTFDTMTVKSFLEFIYADKTKGEGRDFHASKYTASLLKMAHMYQCQELVIACINHLKGNVTEANAAELFAVATLVDGKPLREVIFSQMIDFEKPLEAVGKNGLKSHKDYQDLIAVWQNKHKVIKNSLEVDLTRTNYSLAGAHQEVENLESKVENLESKVDDLESELQTSQGQINKRRNCHRCRNCNRCRN